MTDYKITYHGDMKVSNVHHIGVKCNEKCYSVIFGEYVDCGFVAYLGGLSTFDDIPYLTKKLSNILKYNKDEKQIMQALSDYAKRKKLV